MDTLIHSLTSSQQYSRISRLLRSPHRKWHTTPSNSRMTCLQIPDTGVHRRASRSKLPRAAQTWLFANCVCEPSSFCEEDYAITRYIAEFINSITNFAYSMFVNPVPCCEPPFDGLPPIDLANVACSLPCPSACGMASPPLGSHVCLPPTGGTLLAPLPRHITTWCAILGRCLDALPHRRTASASIPLWKNAFQKPWCHNYDLRER